MTGEELETRADDTEETLAARIATYKALVRWRWHMFRMAGWACCDAVAGCTVLNSDKWLSGADVAGAGALQGKGVLMCGCAMCGGLYAN